jgi:hypothetical protein
MGPGGKELVAFGRKPADHDQSAFQGIHAEPRLSWWMKRAAYRSRSSMPSMRRPPTRSASAGNWQPG